MEQDRLFVTLQNELKVRPQPPSAACAAHSPPATRHSRLYRCPARPRRFPLPFSPVFRFEDASCDSHPPIQASMPRTAVLKLAKSGGAVKREADERRSARDTRLREYFYGHPSAPLAPATQTLRASELAIYRIGA
jgi:hypothetical protein